MDLEEQKCVYHLNLRLDFDKINKDLTASERGFW